ncbi:MAG: GNAT family N-acetyltransferase [Clostridia bacterium]|nr:GNAT family N-acetyltransferase [Clostridia bacterium]
MAVLFPEKSIVLKNGLPAILRSPRPEEAAEMLDYLRDVSAETHFILREPEECTETVEQEAAFLEGINASPLNVMIVCEVDGEIAGNCQLSFQKRAKVRHRASVAIALRKKYWNLGIGTAFFREMISVAREHGIMQMELEFVEGNDRARALYEKMGFRVYAEHPDAIRLKDGTMLKEYRMLLKL